MSNQTYGVIRGAHLEDHYGYDSQTPEDWGINCSLADTIGVYDCISNGGSRIWVDDSSCRVENCGVQTAEPAGTYGTFAVDSGTQPGDPSMICGNFTRGGKPNWDAAKLPDGTCEPASPCSPGDPPCAAPDTSSFTCPPYHARAEAIVTDEARLRTALFDDSRTWIRLGADISLSAPLDLTPLHQCSGMNFLRFDSDVAGTRRRLMRAYSTGEPMLAWKHDQFGGGFTLHFSGEDLWFDGNDLLPRAP